VDEALSAIKRAIDLDESDDTNANAYGCMGDLLIVLEDYDRALSAVEHALDIRPHDLHIQEFKAKALRGLGRESEAEQIERAVQLRLAEQLALLDEIGGVDG
jgi:tetratricopeptide (TPR) repeat protein